MKKYNEKYKYKNAIIKRMLETVLKTAMTFVEDEMNTANKTPLQHTILTFSSWIVLSKDILHDT